MTETTIGNTREEARIDFEDYLRDIYYRECHMPKDIAIDGENDWFGDLDVEEVIEYANEYAQQIKTRTEAERDSDMLGQAVGYNKALLNNLAIK